MSHVAGCTRLGRPHYLPTCPLPLGGDGRDPGMFGLCLALLNTDPPRLPWLSSSGKTQKLTKRAIHRLTGKHWQALLKSIPCFGMESMVQTMCRLGQIAARGDNIERFLMGRQVFIDPIILPTLLYILSASHSSQVFVVCLVFFAAKLTTIHGRNPDGFLFPVPEVVQVGDSQDVSSTLLRPCSWRPACWPASLSSLWPS